MRKNSKRLLAVLGAVAILAGTALASSVITTRTIQAQFMGIQTVVNGNTVILTRGDGQVLEPFVYNGDTYVPVRALGDALDKYVGWDNDTKTLYVGKSIMSESADELVGYLEECHPAFSLELVPEGYQAAKESLLTVAAQPDCTPLQFTLAAMAYTASLKDGHTAVDPFGGVSQPALDVRWAADGDRLYLLDEAGAPTGAEVVAVGGVRVHDLFATLDTIVPSENQPARDRNHAQWSALPGMLMVLGVPVEEDYSVVLTVQNGGKEETRTVDLAAPAQAEPEPVIATQAMGDVFYVDFNQCVPGEAMDSAVAALSKAVDDGITKVIIDVRGNGGGDSTTCVALLNAMDMEAPMYGVYLRYSPFAQQQRGYDERTGNYTFDRRPETAKTNDKIRLVVLTDEDTYSSATMMGVYVQDGGLGTVIGRTSANRPNHYGDILTYRLSNGLTGTVSHKQWLRPDAEADATALTPDVETALDQNSLQVALDYLK